MKVKIRYGMPFKKTEHVEGEIHNSIEKPNEYFIEVLLKTKKLIYIAKPRILEIKQI